MPVMRGFESIINLGKGGQWRAGAKQVKEIVESEGGNVSYYQVVSGGNPSSVFSVSLFEDMDSFGAFGDKIYNSSKLADWMQRQSELEGFPFSEPVTVNIYQDLHDEVGEPSGVVDSPDYIVGYRQRLIPGQRPAYIAMAKAVREAIKAEGRPVGNSMQCIIGDVGVVTRSMGYASMADWSEQQTIGFSDRVTKILQDAQAAGPIFQSVESRMLRNITATL